MSLKRRGLQGHEHTARITMSWVNLPFSFIPQVGVVTAAMIWANGESDTCLQVQSEHFQLRGRRETTECGPSLSLEGADRGENGLIALELVGKHNGRILGAKSHLAVRPGRLREAPNELKGLVIETNRRKL